tara:strand:- start:732 stop:1433 length:702 start_codon:yes stop_codon:yes gene_type:complete
VAVNLNLRNKVVELSSPKLLAMLDNVYRESLRSMVYSFGNLYYIDGNGNRIRVKSTHGNPERVAGKLKADNTLILPMITVVETNTRPDPIRARYQSIIIDKSWDPDKLKAIRVLSLPPRPVNISYEINIWAKYKSDLDMLRSNIFSMFNPHVDIVTKYSSYNKAFITNERNVGSVEANDTGDRVLQKTFEVTLETYIPTPKFQVTNTGEIKDFNMFDITLDGDPGVVESIRPE